MRKTSKKSSQDPSKFIQTWAAMERKAQQGIATNSKPKRAPTASSSKQKQLKVSKSAIWSLSWKWVPHFLWGWFSTVPCNHFKNAATKTKKQDKPICEKRRKKTQLSRFSLRIAIFLQTSTKPQKTPILTSKTLPRPLPNPSKSIQNRAQELPRALLENIMNTNTKKWGQRAAQEAPRRPQTPPKPLPKWRQEGAKSIKKSILKNNSFSNTLFIRFWSKNN